MLASFVLLSACGPGLASDRSEGGDEAETGAATTSAGAEDSAGTEDSTGAPECPPDPMEEVEGCVFNADCPAGDKCASYSGQSCQFGGMSFGGAGCVPVTGDREPGEPCTISFEMVNPYFTWRLDDCGASGICLEDVGGTREGVCTPYCEGPPQTPTCSAGEECRFGEPSNCFQTCDPTLPNICEGELVCSGPRNLSIEFLCKTASPDPGQLGDACDNSQECDHGLGCLDGAELPACAHERCCTPYCTLDEPGSCADPQLTCLPYYQVDIPPESSAHVGTCGLE